MANASSSPKQIQIEFTPLILASEPSGTPTSYMLPGELLRKIGEFASVEAMRNLIATCKCIRNQPNTWFLQLLASGNNPNRATSGFIVDAIGNEGNTYLWPNAKFFIEDHNVPNDLSIHLLVNTTAEKISSDKVRSMIIQFSGSPKSYEKSREFLKFLFLKVPFENLKCLMVCGIELSNEFSHEMGKSKLDVFYMRNFCHYADLTYFQFSRYLNSLRTLYVVHPNMSLSTDPLEKLEKLVIYCPKSRKDIIEKRAIAYTKFGTIVAKCHALKEM